MASAHDALLKELHCLQNRRKGMDQKAMLCLLLCPVCYKVPGMPNCQVLDSHKKTASDSKDLLLKCNA